MKLLFVGDVHLSDRPPTTRTERYRDDILAKLREIAALSVEHDVRATIFLGDIFHSKVPHRTSHETVQELVDILRLTRRPIILPGNHDYSGANPATLDRAPLGVLFRAKVAESIGLGPLARRIGPVDRVAVASPRFATISREDREYSGGAVVVAGVREEEPLTAFGEIQFPQLGTPTLNIIAAHSPIFPPGSNPPYDHFKAYDVASAITADVAVVVYGHIHDPHGAYEIRTGDRVTWFVNNGSVSRGSLHDANPKRTPAVTLIEVDFDQPPPGRPAAWSATEVPLQSARHWQEVFRVAEVGEVRERDAEAAQFAEALSVASVEAFSLERVIDAVRGRTEAPEAVRARAVELIEQQVG